MRKGFPRLGGSIYALDQKSNDASSVRYISRGSLPPTEIGSRTGSQSAGGRGLSHTSYEPIDGFTERFQ
jgi:hypothetical protein